MEPPAPRHRPLYTAELEQHRRTARTRRLRTALLGLALVALGLALIAGTAAMDKHGIWHPAMSLGGVS